MILHTDLAIFEQQMRLLFRPNHAFAFCIDAKAPPEVSATVQAIIDCYRAAWPGAQLMIAKDPPIDVYWGHIR